MCTVREGVFKARENCHFIYLRVIHTHSVELFFLSILSVYLNAKSFIILIEGERGES